MSDKDYLRQRLKELDEIKKSQGIEKPNFSELNSSINSNNNSSSSDKSNNNSNLKNSKTINHTQNKDLMSYSYYEDMVEFELFPVIYHFLIDKNGEFSKDYCYKFFDLNGNISKFTEYTYKLDKYFTNLFDNKFDVFLMIIKVCDILNPEFKNSIRKLYNLKERNAKH